MFWVVGVFFVASCIYEYWLKTSTPSKSKDKPEMKQKYDEKIEVQNVPLQPTVVATPVVTNVQLRSTFINVSPSPIKTHLFFEGKVEGNIIMRSQNGMIKRLVILFKNGQRMKGYKLPPLYGVQDVTSSVLNDTISDAKTLVHSVYPGKKKKPNTTEPAIKVQPQVVSPVVVQQAAVVTAVPHAVEKREFEVVEVPPVKEVEQDRTPIIKGFIAQYVGTVVSAKMEPHANGFNQFVVQLDTADGPQVVTGNDLKRAISNAKVGTGDKVRVVHLKNEPITLSNGNASVKKMFQVAKLASAQAGA